MNEEAIHKAVVRHLRERGTGATIWHTPNASKAAIGYRMKLKALGLLPGVSDLTGFHGKEWFALELKKDGGRPTEEQLAFQSSWRANGGHAVVAEGLDEALAILEEWQFLKRSA